MEGYKTEWEKLNARSNSRSRDTAYKDIIKKAEDAAISSKNSTDSTSRNVRIEIKPAYQRENNQNSSNQNISTSEHRSVYEKSKNHSRVDYEEPKPPKKGSWRKEMERYEEDLELKNCTMKPNERWMCTTDVIHQPIVRKT